ncbi:MAG: hypothetical protein ACJAXN_001354 [Psychromonas sp.]|jgi:hypothetical protein
MSNDKSGRLTGLNIKRMHLLRIVLLSYLSPFAETLIAGNLHDVKAAAVLQHIGLPHANFVTISPIEDKCSESGFNVDIVRGFAVYLSIEFQFVKGRGDNVSGLLTGKNAK